MADAAKISPEYVDLVSLATRQILGSLDITVLSDGQSSVNASDVKIFMKNMGDDQCVPRRDPSPGSHLTLFSDPADALILWRRCTRRGLRFFT